MYSRTFDCVAGIAGILAALFAVTTLIVGVGMVGASLDMLSDPSPMLAFNHHQSEWLRWSNVTSLLGYGVLLLPVVFYVGAHLNALEPRIAPMAQAAGVGYVMFAGINAAVLLSVWPAFQLAYPLIDPVQRGGVEVAFRALTDAAEIGFQSLAYLLGGGWWIVSGALLRGYRPQLGWLSISLGIAAWSGAAALLLRVGPLALVALSLCFVLTPIWSGAIAAIALRSRPLGRRMIDVGPPQGHERRSGDRRIVSQTRTSVLQGGRRVAAAHADHASAAGGSGDE